MYLRVAPGRRGAIADIAAAHRVSRNHLDKVVRRMSEAGLVATLRGRGGGVQLTREPSTITVGDVMRASSVALSTARPTHQGGRESLSAVLVERGTPGVEYQVIDKVGHRTCQNVTMTFRDVRVPAENLLAEGDGDLVINRNFTWSGPIAGIAAVGVARGAYEFALKWAKTFTGGGVAPIINHQAVGYLLAEIAAKIEACRYMCWKAAHYMDTYDDGGHALSGMNKTLTTDLMQRVVVDCMRVVGVNALDRRFGLEKSYRESIVFPLYDAGNLAMQQRRAWGVMTDPGFSPDLFVDSEPFAFKKSMEGFGVGTELR